MSFRYPGLKPRLTAGEINRWNDAADRSLRGGTKPHSALEDPQSYWVWIQNDSGSDRERFDCMGLDGTLWELLEDGTTDLMFSGATAATNKTPAILLEPIANGAVGRAVIHGLALARVSGGSGDFAEVAPANHRLEPSDSGSITLLSAPHATDPKLLPVLLGQSKSNVDAIIDIRLSGDNLQYTKDGTSWTTWHTAGNECPP